MADLLVARHGQSEWNALGRWQGQADPPLSPLGRRQAAQAAERLEGIEVVVTSDLQRARHTGEVIAERLALAPPVVDPDLRERYAGPWQGLTREQIQQRFPGWLDEGRRPEDWESDEEVRERALRAVRRIAAAHEGSRVLVVSHGGVIYQLELLLGASFDRIPNLSARWLHARGNGFELGVRQELVEAQDRTHP